MFEPNEICLLSKYFKNVDEESFTPINFPVSPIFKSLSLNFGVNFMNPAGLGIGSPWGLLSENLKIYLIHLLIFLIEYATIVQQYRVLHPT